MNEFTIRPIELGPEHSEYLSQLHENLNDLNENLRPVTEILRNIMDRVERESRLWDNHPELHSSFERLYNSSELLLVEANNLLRTSVDALIFIRNIQTDLSNRFPRSRREED